MLVTRPPSPWSVVSPSSRPMNSSPSLTSAWLMQLHSTPAHEAELSGADREMGCSTSPGRPEPLGGSPLDSRVHGMTQYSCWNW
jgi:hypothetical protein